MKREKENGRLVWSYRLCGTPQEEETAQLEETLRDRPASFWEDARALERYIALTGLSQAACAKKLGRSQASVANRLRLLKLPEDVRRRLQEKALTERHARALLRLSSADTQRRALEAMLRSRMNVAAAESFVEELLETQTAAPQVPSPLSSLLAELERLQRSEPSVSMELQDLGNEMLLSLRIPKKMGF